jgi:hypothetical protein
LRNLSRERRRAISSGPAVPSREPQPETVSLVGSSGRRLPPVWIGPAVIVILEPGVEHEVGLVSQAQSIGSLARRWSLVGFEGRITPVGAIYIRIRRPAHGSFAEPSAPPAYDPCRVSSARSRIAVRGGGGLVIDGLPPSTSRARLADRPAYCGRKLLAGCTRDVFRRMARSKKPLTGGDGHHRAALATRVDSSDSDRAVGPSSDWRSNLTAGPRGLGVRSGSQVDRAWAWAHTCWR